MEGGGGRQDLEPSPLFVLFACFVSRENSETKREHAHSRFCLACETLHPVGIHADVAERRTQRSTRSQAPFFGGASQCQADPRLPGVRCGPAAQRRSLDLGPERTIGLGASLAQRGVHQHERGGQVCGLHTQRPFFIVGFCLRRLRSRWRKSSPPPHP